MWGNGEIRDISDARNTPAAHLNFPHLHRILLPL
jgi:hypothetical protein